MPGDGHNRPPAPGSANRAARLVQITDCHLGPTEEYCLAGVRTLNSFREVMARIRATGDSPDLVMATGDISAKGTREAYRHFVRVMSESGLDYAWLPGNHDDFTLMLEGLPVSPYCPVLELGEWRLISLNTAIPGRVEGRLSASELGFLEKTLDSEQDHPAILFLHHPPMAIGCQWLDRQRVVNGDELGRLLEGRNNVRAIFTGHVHQQTRHSFHGVPLFTTPSTCFQFTPGRSDFSVDTKPPAYRWIDLFAGGGMDTGVVWIDDTAEVVNTDVEGY